ncbi:MAG: hypothetical protein A3D44_03135 [Candidatus Staskawiczbacteria bacterium RIFCSPHIGHO2_02_FULL_42_22]|uniref:Nucleotide pyrophosphohydrolase n=1 Tax=Candidatus Staskawiczbacteria bacterium RIFCSPHIGHO2_02_FULL_42_22 TaxID=1802207 RepID=A0A1G2I5G6_9BACT|nr:MAG: hypothetical protein A3D44_03135 [Candidatus Staskawiczbacteria bacterium RIFCSPHIGHO2_02_FULL_42_22]
MKELEKKIHQFLKVRKWDNLRPSDLAKSIMIEGAELLELFQWENLLLKDVKKNEEKLKEIKKELADVLIYAIQMSVLLGFDTQKIIYDKIAHVDKKYPAAVVKNRFRDAKSNSNYWRIKKEYRKKGL